jgi:uncharacterized protein
MERLFEKFLRKVDETPLDFRRYLLDKVDWSNRLIGIKGARGAGKTTLLLQYARLNLPMDHQTLYVSLDDLYFSDNRLVQLADAFVRQGGKYLLLDEVHRYRNWSVEIKNIYDDHSGLRLIFTGSSIIQLNNAIGDLSRRAVMYELAGLSFREYIHLRTGRNLPVINWSDIAGSHTDFARTIVLQIRPLESFQDYLSHGYYPYFLENPASYPHKLSETIDLAMTADLPAAFDISYTSIEKLKQLLFIVAQSVPFQPNVSKLSERIGVTRNTLVTFFKYLEELRIIKRVFSSVAGIGALQKPDKILMHHPNLLYALADSKAEKGSVRESFFVNQAGFERHVHFSKIGDFVIDDRIFEVGGKKKTNRQIIGAENAFVVADDMEVGMGNKLPLWIFGFLY